MGVYYGSVYSPRGLAVCLSVCVSRCVSRNVQKKKIKQQRQKNIIKQQRPKNIKKAVLSLLVAALFALISQYHTLINIL